MSSRQEQAIATFQSGANCAQSVVTTYAQALGFDAGLAENLALGFGGGMGRLQNTCGAVTGAFMVLGIYNADKYDELKERKQKTAEMVQAFNARFTEMHGSTQCRTLLGVDLMTEEGREQLHTGGLHVTVCEQCIAHAVDILDEMLK
ncbi:MAG TPA: C-GCAxxG-C-C family protein [Bacteroidota bacterium]|nr:C-GCAxxG-C-C family protein [Bacteroidota bacterium]